jgi:hypothetical protein
MRTRAVSPFGASVPSVGGRQRHSEFMGLSPEQLARLAKDRRWSRAERLKLVTELKYAKVRNRQKRSK